VVLTDAKQAVVTRSDYPHVLMVPIGIGGRGLIEQRETEPAVRELVQFSGLADSRRSQHLLDNSRNKESVVWILLAVFGVVSVIAFIYCG
jgi:hypothetical protein